MLRSLALAAIASQLSSAALWPDLSSPAPEQAGGERDAAVIVGIEKYSFAAPVPGAARNAEDWYLFLTKTRKLKVSRVKLLRDIEATREEILDAAAWAARAVESGGTLWFVFIGHGASAKDGQDGVLVGADAQQRLDSLYHRSLRRSELMSTLGSGAQQRTVVVLDSCFSGRTPEGRPLIAGLQPLVLVSPIRAWPNAAIFTAASSDQFAGPLPGASRPAFSYFMLGALRGWADADKDRAVTAREALAFTRDSLSAVLKDRHQTPELLGAVAGALAHPVNEEGPDLGALAVALRPGSGDLSFGEVDSVAPPVMGRVLAEGAFRDTNIAVERLVERALLQEASPSYLAVEKMLAWCVVAATRLEPNPYRAKAAAACAAWEAFARRTHEQKILLLEDYATLSGYLGLRLKTTGERLAGIDAFLKAYSPLKDARAISIMRAAREAVIAGKTPVLPVLDDAGPPRGKVADLPEQIAEVAFSTAPELARYREACRRRDRGACADFLARYYDPKNQAADHRRHAGAIALAACFGGERSACETAVKLQPSLGDEIAVRDAFMHGCLVLRDYRSCAEAAHCARRDYSVGDATARSGLVAEAACIQGDAPLCSGAGMQRLWPNPPPDGARIGRLFYSKGCRQQDHASCQALEAYRARIRQQERQAAIYATQEKQLKLREEACEAGSVPDCVFLAEVFRKSGVAENEARAARCEARACEFGNLLSCENVAKVLLSGSDGFTGNPDKEVWAHAKACAAGKAESCLGAARLLKEGAQAKGLALKACEKRLPEACVLGMDLGDARCRDLVAEMCRDHALSGSPCARVGRRP